MTDKEPPNESRFNDSIQEAPDGQAVTQAEIERLLLNRIEKPGKDRRDAQFELARLYGMTGRPDAARELLETLLDEASDDGDTEEMANCSLNLGCLMEQIGDYESAIAFYRTAFALEPTGGPTWHFIHNNLGFCLNHCQRFEEGERFCRDAIAIDASRANAHKNLGLTLEGQGRFADAARCYVNATQAEALDPRSLQHLEDLLARQPGLLDEPPGLREDLVNCRAAVKHAADAQPDFTAHWNALRARRNISPRTAGAAAVAFLLVAASVLTLIGPDTFAVTCLMPVLAASIAALRRVARETQDADITARQQTQIAAVTALTCLGFLTSVKYLFGGNEIEPALIPTLSLLAFVASFLFTHDAVYRLFCSK